MVWKTTIERVENGFVVESFEGEKKTTVVFESYDIEDGELECMETLLRHIQTYFGVFYSKHNKKNLIIKIEEDK